MIKETKNGVSFFLSLITECSFPDPLQPALENNISGAFARVLGKDAHDYVRIKDGKRYESRWNVISGEVQVRLEGSTDDWQSIGHMGNKYSQIDPVEYITGWAIDIIDYDKRFVQ